MSMITVNSDYSITLNPAQPAILVGAPIPVALNGLTICDLKFDQSVYVNGLLTAADTAIVLNSVIGLPGITAAVGPTDPYQLIPTAGGSVNGPWKANAHPIHVSGTGVSGF